MLQERSLKTILRNLPQDSIIFRTDYPQYHSEFVGNTLSSMVSEGSFVKLAQGIYLKPRMSKYGAIKPSAYQVAKRIAKRDKAKILPAGVTVLNELGLSTQVPVNYTFITTGSARTVNLDTYNIIFKQGAPRNFAFRTKLVAYIVQALKAVGKKNIDPAMLGQLATLLAREPDKAALAQDLKQAPQWMRKLLTPLITSNDESTVDK